jgi:hypothetical protein
MRLRTPPPREYHLVHVGSADTLNSVDTCCAGIATFSNLHDLAYEVRQAAIAAANARFAAYHYASAPLPAVKVSQQGSVSMNE